VPRILVVDDEPLISMMVEDWLTELGCEVVGPAVSVGDGLDLAANAALDGAILDIRLGKETSYPIAGALRERGVPFAFATGAGDSDPGSGFENQLILPKPFDFAAVQDVLSKLLAGKQEA
jgi:DNA-binding response OmpR family regulator